MLMTPSLVLKFGSPGRTVELFWTVTSTYLPLLDIATCSDVAPTLTELTSLPAAISTMVRVLFDCEPRPPLPVGAVGAIAPPTLVLMRYLPSRVMTAP